MCFPIGTDFVCLRQLVGAKARASQTLVALHDAASHGYFSLTQVCTENGPRALQCLRLRFSAVRIVVSPCGPYDDRTIVHRPLARRFLVALET